MRNGNLIQLCSGRYYQGSGVLSHLGGDAVLLGRRALVVADAAVWQPGAERCGYKGLALFRPLLPR